VILLNGQQKLLLFVYPQQLTFVHIITEKEGVDRIPKINTFEADSLERLKNTPPSLERCHDDDTRSITQEEAP
jgi:hypothetical protein